VYSKNLIKQAFEGFRDFKIGGQEIHTVQYAALVLLANEAAMPNSSPNVT
jgi:hypothetical protein